MIGPEAGPQPAVPLTPVPTVFGAGQGVGADGQTWVLLTVNTPTGMQMFHLTPENARSLAAALDKFGAAGQLILGVSNGHKEV